MNYVLRNVCFGRINAIGDNAGGVALTGIKSDSKLTAYFKVGDVYHSVIRPFKKSIEIRELEEGKAFAGGAFLSEVTPITRYIDGEIPSTISGRNIARVLRKVNMTQTRTGTPYARIR